MRRFINAISTSLSGRRVSKSAQKVEQAGLASGSSFEQLENRQMLANIVWDGGPAGTGTDFNTAANWVGDVLPGVADTAVINTAGSTITVGASRAVTAVESSRTIQFNSGTFTTTGTNTMTAPVTMSGGTLSGGTWNFSGAGNLVRATSSGGTLAGVTIGGEIVIDTTSANVLVSGATSFTAARLTANGATIQLAPGYVLNSLISVEGATAGIRTISLAVGGAGTVTNGPTGIMRLAANSGGGMNISNNSVATLVNNGLISGESAAATLTINNTTFTNNGTIQQIAAGTLNISPTNWTNPGTINGTGGGIIQLSGTMNATGGVGAFTTAAASVRVSGTVTNTGNTIALNAVTGSWTMFGGTITNGTITYAGGSTLRMTNSSGTLSSVAVGGDLVFDTTSSVVLLTGTTSFATAHLAANGATLQMAPGYTLNNQVVVEGATAGIRTVSLAVGGAGTVTFGASAVVRLDSTSGGNLNISNSSTATLINNGLISAEATGRVLTIGNTTFTNNTTVQASAGTLAISPTTFTNNGAVNGTGAVVTIDGAWTDSGTITVDNTTLNLNGTFNTASFNFAGLTRTGGTINLGAVLTNTGSTLALTAATGTWNLLGGTILNGSVSFAGGAVLRATNSGGTLNGVALAGDLLLDSTSATVLLTGSTTFSAARLQANGANLQMAPGFTLNSLVVAEGATAGTRTITMAVGGTGTVTFGPSAVVRHAAGTGGAFNISNSSVSTLVNNGLITAEATGQVLTINNSVLTNNATIQVSAGTVTINATNWTNPGTINATGGIVQLDGTLNATAGIGTFTTSAGTVRVAGVITNTGNSIALTAATGSWNMFGGNIVNGSMTFAGGTALRGSSSGGTLSSVSLGGEVLLDSTSASLLLSGNTSFAAARLIGSSVNLQMAPGYALNSLVVAEGATAGPRTITLAVGGVGTVTFGPSAVVRLAAGSGGGLNVSNSSAATLNNFGFITAEATGQTLTINNSTLTNSGTIQVTAGTVTINSTNWSNPGTINATGGVVQLDGTFNATAGIGTFTTSAAIVRVAGTITNTGNTIALTAATGSWIMFGGNIVNGSMTFAGSTALRTSTSGGTLTSVALGGELLLDTASVSVLLAGNTSFTAARLTASSVNLQMAPGYTLNSLVVAEGATVGTRTITLAVGGAGTVTFGPSAVLRHAAGTGGAFNFSNSSVATLINNGLITAEASGQILTINNSVLTNNGMLQVAAGTLTVNVTNWTNPGTINGTGGIIQVDGTLNATAGIGTFTTSAAVVRLAGVITNTGNTIALTAATGSWIMFGGNIVNGSMSFAGGTNLRTSNSGGTLTSVALAGELLLDSTSASVLLAGNTTFTAARLTANGVVLQMAPGYTLTNLVIAEGATVGTRTITLAVGGAGTVTFSPTAVVRLGATSGGALNISNSSTATLVNNGLITAESAGQILTINPTGFANAGTVQALAGNLNIANTFTNTGLLSGTTGNLNITGTLNNAGATQTINAAAGTWRLVSGNINGGTVNIAGGVLAPTSSGGLISNVTINGDIIFDTTSANLQVSGTTTFTAVRLQANGANLQLLTSYTLSNLVVAEGAAVGARTISLAVGGAGTVTFAPSAVVRLAAGSGGALNLSNSSAATLVNNGMISAEAAGQILTINPTTFTNNGTVQAINGGAVNLAGTFTNAGLLAGVSGNLNITGTLNNIGFTQTINALAGAWRLVSGTINGGTINMSGGGILRATNSGGTLSNVTVNGDLVLDSTSASILLAGTTTVGITHLAANNASLQLSPGYFMNGTVLVEGAAAGARVISLAVGGAGTVTFGPQAVVRIVSGTGAGLNISNSSAATLINNGVISSESSGQMVTINPTAFTSSNVLRTANGGRMSINVNGWSNAATLDIQSGDLTLNGTGTFVNSGQINLGGTITVNSSTGFTATSSSIINATIGGTANNQFGRIVVGAFNAALDGALNIGFVNGYEPPIVSTFNIVTVTPTNRSISGGFSSTVMPPPGVDGKNFMFNDSRHIQFAFSSLADFNSDTVVDFFDYLDFVQALSSNDPSADFNNDTTIDFFDYLDFLVIFSRF